MKTDLIECLSTLTTIKKDALEETCDIISNVITNSVFESFIDENESTEIDIGIGTLTVFATNKELKFRFVPSAKLQESIVESIKTKTDPLELKIEETLKERLVHTYKDLL